jgi:hypothetical protein
MSSSSKTEGHPEEGIVMTLGTWGIGDTTAMLLELLLLEAMEASDRETPTNQIY